MLATENFLRKIIVIFAVAGVAALLGCKPAGPSALLSGDELLREGQPAQAIPKLKRAVDLLPDEPRAWNLLGLAYHRAGQPQMAAQAYRQALVKDRSNIIAVAHYNLGCLLLEQNGPAQAVDELRSFTLSTNSALGFVKLASAQLRLRQFDAAERNFNTALRLDSKNIEALNGIGVVHAQRNQRDAAQYFHNALKANPKYAPAVLNAAVLAQQNSATKLAALYRFRDYLAITPEPPHADAVKSLVRQLEIDLAPLLPHPTNIVAAPKTNTPAVALQAGNPPSRTVAPATNVKPAVVIAKTNPIIATQKTNPPPPLPAKTNQLAVAPNVPAPAPDLPVTIVTVAGDPPPRIAPAQPVTGARATNIPAAVSVDATAPDIATPVVPQDNDEEKKPGLFARLNPFRDRQKSPPITNDVPRTIVLAPRTNVTAASPKPAFPRYAYLSPAAPSHAGNRINAERAMSRAVRAQRGGNTNEALLDYQLSLTADPTYFDAQYNLALLAFQMGDLKRSLAAWETALAMQPESINARYNFALALKQGNYANDAAKELERILEAKPNETRAHLTLGNLYAQQLNEPQKARVHYTKVVELDPRNPQAPAIRYWLAANP